MHFLRITTFCVISGGKVRLKREDACLDNLEPSHGLPPMPDVEPLLPPTPGIAMTNIAVVQRRIGRTDDNIDVALCRTAENLRRLDRSQRRTADNIRRLHHRIVDNAKRYEADAKRYEADAKLTTDLINWVHNCIVDDAKRYEADAKLRKIKRDAENTKRDAEKKRKADDIERGAEDKKRYTQH